MAAATTCWASASLLAATAVKDYLAAHGIKGRVRYYGCPAEEGGAAKGFMVRAGAFADVDIAISWHPVGVRRRRTSRCRWPTRASIFRFTGRASHAAAAPHLGRSALDAVELMNVGVNYMREHMPSDARMHYAILDAGGIAPNVVQAFAKVRYLIRARNLPELNRLIERVRKIADGAALMTETAVQDAGGQRGLQPAGQHAAGAGDAGQPASASARRRSTTRTGRSRAKIQATLTRGGYRERRSAASACRCSRTRRCATRSCRWMRSARR